MVTTPPEPTLPDEVRRCQRRSFYRVETARINLPVVDVWPLLDPKSILLAERANELAVEGDPADRRDARELPKDDLSGVRDE